MGNSVPRYMRIIEPVSHRKVGENKAKEVQTKEIVHFVELHNGKLDKLFADESNGVFYKQIYLAKDLSKVRKLNAIIVSPRFAWARFACATG